MGRRKGPQRHIAGRKSPPPAGNIGRCRRWYGSRCHSPKWRKHFSPDIRMPADDASFCEFSAPPAPWKTGSPSLPHDLRGGPVKGKGGGGGEKGIPSFWAASLPQNAMESATIPSGAIRSISRQIFSSRASVARTIRSMERPNPCPPGRCPPGRASSPTRHRHRGQRSRRLLE